MNNIILLIPAYKPTISLKRVIHDVIDLNVNKMIAHIVVVNDGSGENFDSLFSEIETFSHVTVIHHAINLGKGAALKTGFNYALVTWAETTTIVTADADGQHAPEDILRVAQTAIEYPNALIVGARQFGKDVPLRSRFGNILTRYVFRIFTGLKLTDTQTGLRAYPKDLCLQNLRININGYDFEMENLVRAKQIQGSSLKLMELPIRTIYEEGNKSSHFNPLLDSMRIYFVFLRFSMVSFISFLIDYGLFSLVLFMTNYQAWEIQIGVRIFTSLINFLLNKSFVFHSDNNVYNEYIKYLVAMGYVLFASTILIYICVNLLGINPYIAKPIAELATFLLSFLLVSWLVYTPFSLVDTLKNKFKKVP